MQKKKIKLLRKQFIIPIDDEEVLLETNFRLVEILERVYRLNSDYVAINLLSDERNILRSQIAEVIALWVQGKTAYKYGDVKELVMGADMDAYKVYLGAIQAVVLFCSRQIDERTFDSLSSGNGLPAPEEDEQEEQDEEEVEEPVKKPTTTRKRKIRKAG